MANKLVLALLLIALISVRAEESENNKEALVTLQKIENSKFGHTLLDTIQLQMEAGDPVSDLIRMLNDMEDNLQREQQEDDDYIFNLQDQCDQEVERLTQEIEAAQARATELTEELKIKIPLRDQKLREQAQKQEFLQIVNDKVAELDQRKELKDQEWAQEQQEHDHAQYAIERAKEIISQSSKAGQGAFLQKGKSVFAQVSEHLTSSLKQYEYKRKSWNTIFNMLAQVTASPGVQADQSAVQKVITLCEDIIAKIQDSREIERRDYAHWVDEYTNTKTGLQERASQLQNDINELENSIDILNKRISFATAERNEQNERVTEKTAQKTDKLRWCDDENGSYSQRRQSRDDDREVVSDAIALFNAQIRTFRRYVRDRTSTVQRAGI